MANQMRLGRYRTNCTFDLETMAKMRSFVEGKKVPAESIGGRNVRKKTRDMTTNDLVEQWANKAMANVKLSESARKWMVAKGKRLGELRAEADEKVRSGAYRKPQSEWLKRGRVAGKHYPNIDKAMKKLGIERRKMSAKGVKWRK